MTAGKVIPIFDSAIEAGDRAVREDVYAVLIAATNDVNAKLAALEHKLDLKIEELIAKRDEEEGQPRVRNERSVMPTLQDVRRA